jgi:hypothetical protein
MRSMNAAAAPAAPIPACGRSLRWIWPPTSATPYPELLARVVRAMDATESVMSQKQAQQAIEVCRQTLLGDKWR